VGIVCFKDVSPTEKVLVLAKTANMMSLLKDIMGERWLSWKKCSSSWKKRTPSWNFCSSSWKNHVPSWNSKML
uniref:hypothetical protein n=1 Tax=Paenisporosarcina sp. TG20 TaxID=1211706 RepID=UPI001ED8FE5A